MIEGVVIKELQTFPDERGFFRELIRSTDDFFKEGFGQWSHSLMYAGATKAWHIHKKQIDWWYVATGVLKVALHDTRKDSKTYKQTVEIFLGENRTPAIIRVPPGVAHGCKCIHGPVNLFYVTSNVYNPQDEGRIPHNDPDIGYDWVTPPPIK
jgi:dTDP-4-dehydrorhamnose 3,5-epimerase